MPEPVNPNGLLADLRRIEHSVLDIIIAAETDCNRKIASKLRKHLMEVRQTIAGISS